LAFAQLASTLKALRLKSIFSTVWSNV